MDVKGELTLFQSAPPTEARGDMLPMAPTTITSCFNPLPPPRRGEMVIPLRFRAHAFRFQSAPPTEARGDEHSTGKADKAFRFQSAPPTEARGDCSSDHGTGKTDLFQSAPPTEARGDDGSRCRYQLPFGFNPLPPPRRGEIAALPLLPILPKGFNPLPPPRRGEMLLKDTEHLGGSVSIRSPHRGEGRLADKVRDYERWQVSIRSPHRGEGRCSTSGNSGADPGRFQSAPPTEARGDIPADRVTLLYGGVSIRSPHRGEGRSWNRSIPPQIGHGFNPLPPPRRGEIVGAVTSSSKPNTFQSAPPTEARGDWRARL